MSCESDAKGVRTRAPWKRKKSLGNCVHRWAPGAEAPALSGGERTDLLHVLRDCSNSELDECLETCSHQGSKARVSFCPGPLPVVTATVCQPLAGRADEDAVEIAADYIVAFGIVESRTTAISMARASLRALEEQQKPPTVGRSAPRARRMSAVAANATSSSAGNGTNTGNNQQLCPEFGSFEDSSNTTGSALVECVPVCADPGTRLPSWAPEDAAECSSEPCLAAE